MILVNTFEEPFGDMHGKGVWSKLGKKAHSRINRSVVALASFNGEKRIFACTGFFIGWNGSTKILTSASLIRTSGDENSIVENLRIEVLLPSNRRINGTLEHYDLHYNVALVSVKNCCDFALVTNAQISRFNCFDVAAVGRCFKSGVLMAMSGEKIYSTGTLDCDFLAYSSCRITKVIICFCIAYFFMVSKYRINSLFAIGKRCASLSAIKNVAVPYLPSSLCLSSVPFVLVQCTEPSNGAIWYMKRQICPQDRTQQMFPCFLFCHYGI
ncbi:hypothetical protein HU200_000824 [Digitaria exilis]|uniref:Uncharacterized protein n=1 Tax=Digitaria exilis TaxID=1010633 RepID=A0A835G133_9POAL|nr:hypothetical protein HU200_000824 [Digitaria exilis]